LLTRGIPQQGWCIIDENLFWAAYDFNNFKIVTVSNPTSKDYAFQITMQVGVDPASGKLLTEARHYIVKAGGNERFPGVVARYYLDQMSKLLAQEEDRFKLFADYGTRKEYYDRLIVDVEDLANQGMVELPHAKQQVIEEAPAQEEAFAGLTSEKPRLGRPVKNN
jgi:hypothetical protein